MPAESPMPISFSRAAGGRLSSELFRTPFGRPVVPDV